MKPEWSRLLQRAREDIGLTQRQIGELAGISAETVRGYEGGRRTPNRERLAKVLRALEVSASDGRRILEAAGFAAPDTLFPNWRFPNYFYSVDELVAAVEQVPWPQFILDNNVELIAANHSAQALWHVDLVAERASRTRSQMNLLSVASDHHFADHLVNWDECVAVIAASFKGQPRDPESLEDPSVYFNAVLAEFAAGDPQFLRRLIEVFAAAPPREPKCRWNYPVVWRDDDFGEMRFIALVSTASEPDGLAFNDWIPVDAGTWGTLERVRKRQTH